MHTAQLAECTPVLCAMSRLPQPGPTSTRLDQVMAILDARPATGQKFRNRKRLFRLEIENFQKFHAFEQN